MKGEKGKPYKIISFRIPSTMGRRAVWVFQYRAADWREHYRPLTTNFKPKVPGHLTDQREYFATRYRIKINGVWYKDGARFTMLSQAEIYAIIESLENQVASL